MKSEITNRSRNLRYEQTSAEELFWRCVRNRQFNGLKFLRQHPIVFVIPNGGRKYFIADFYCRLYKLVIEIDGGIHDTQKDYDEFRDNILASDGYKILRFKNDDIFNNIWWVMKEIENVIGLNTLEKR